MSLAIVNLNGADRRGIVYHISAFLYDAGANITEITSHYGIPYHHVPVTRESKKVAEGRMLELFTRYKVDLLVLARYMQVLSPILLDVFPNRIINVRNCFLPAFKGARPYHQAYEKGVKIIGASSHYATADLDMGPIIKQEIERIDHSHSVEDMVRMGRDVEKKVFAAAVKAHLVQRVVIYKGRTIIFN